jgi:hypothetical protein
VPFDSDPPADFSFGPLHGQRMPDFAVRCMFFFAQKKNRRIVMWSFLTKAFCSYWRDEMWVLLNPTDVGSEVVTIHADGSFSVLDQRFQQTDSLDNIFIQGALRVNKASGEGETLTLTSGGKRLWKGPATLQLKYERGQWWGLA